MIIGGLAQYGLDMPDGFRIEWTWWLRDAEIALVTKNVFLPVVFFVVIFICSWCIHWCQLGWVKGVVEWLCVLLLVVGWRFGLAE